MSAARPQVSVPARPERSGHVFLLSRCSATLSSDLAPVGRSSCAVRDRECSILDMCDDGHDLDCRIELIRCSQKQSMAELKLRRLAEHNVRLREDLDRPRVRISEASAGCVRGLLSSDARRLIRYCKTTKDPLCPSVWGPVDKRDDPYGPGAQAQGGGCCSIQ